MDAYQILNSDIVRILLRDSVQDSAQIGAIPTKGCWLNLIFGNAKNLIESNGSAREDIYSIGVAALNVFLQSNVTGPPLNWEPLKLLFPRNIADDPQKLGSLRQVLLQDLSIDGEAIYRLIPNVELFSLAKCLLNHPAVVTADAPAQYRWARVSVNFWHQKLLNENAASLQEDIYRDLDVLEQDLRQEGSSEQARHLVQRATIHTLHGLDHRAREDLKRATETTGFEFKLTGRLGKRTKFQQNDLSQLVVLAKSANANGTDATGNLTGETKSLDLDAVPKPQDLDLNDDTLLESIAFSASGQPPSSAEDASIPPSLAAIDPSNQPRLAPLDAIILLAYASSITNTSPADGLTREETLPYATRVLQDGSTNWQIYTQALLVRSRIEGYKSRTIERGVLQLQALVDQVIVETTGNASTDDSVQDEQDSAATSFLPRPKPSESAPAPERLQYIHQLASPTRWELEAELASRWVSLGGLRTALEIYERLEMSAEVALCWAANDREDKAKNIIRRQLYTSSQQSRLPAETIIDIEDTNTPDLNSERSDLPPDAPRLFCILGDLEKSPAAYERAWEVSNHRYARAQRSLGKYYFTRNELDKADEAYAKSLKVNPLNHATWFSLGCVRLQTENWAGAVTAFARAIQIEDTDAESWSNMAAALVQLPPEVDVNDTASQAASLDTTVSLDDDDNITQPPSKQHNPQRHLLAAFTSLKRAAALKRDSHRIWQNLLAVAVKLVPPPHTDILIAETRIIELRAKYEGEGCVDVEVVEQLLQHLVTSFPAPSAAAPPASSASPTATTLAAALAEPTSQSKRKGGFSNMLLSLLLHRISPLITSSRRLHLLLARTHIYLSHPLAALECYEKAWRVTLNRSEWEGGSESNKEAREQWNEVVTATMELVDGYESLGERVREGAGERVGEGKGEGKGEGEMVCKEWRFKARSAVRGVLGRGREAGWEGGEGWRVLEDRMEGLKVVR
ncbi:MAG: hypothetical protein Q9220_003793 [cf. Caloplaca sp. 1 TL-2023]